jgi:hypothetical protein
MRFGIPLNLMFAGLLLAASVSGCKKPAAKNPSVPPSPVTVATPAPATPADADIVGRWVVTSVEGTGEDPGKSIIANLRSAKYWFNPDHTFNGFSNESAVYSGFWTATGYGIAFFAASTRGKLGRPGCHDRF